MIFHIKETNGFEFYVEAKSKKQLEKHFKNHKITKITGNPLDSVYDLDDALDLFC